MTWDPLEKAKNSKTFCIMPWMQQYIGTSGDVKPCCVYEHKTEIGNLKDNSLKEIWNNEDSKSIRLKMLSGETVSACSYCNNAVSPHSAREKYNDRFFDNNSKFAVDAVSSTLADGSVPEHKLYYMDVRFNNLCNLKCRTCTPHFSTSWILDYRKLWDIKDGQYTKDNEFQFPGKTEDHAFNEMLPHFPHLKQVYFAGGEPLIQKQHYETLEHLIELGQTDCELTYNTNLSKLRLGEHDVFEYWLKFDRVNVNASIDGSYKKAEYWRSGTKWKELVSNAKLISPHSPKIILSIGFTLSWPNVFNMFDLHKEWVLMGIIKPEHFIINFLNGPYYYALPILPAWKKEQVEVKCREHIEWLKSVDRDKQCVGLIKRFEHVIDFMYNGGNESSTRDSFTQFHKVTSKLDEIRGESFFEIFPEHLDIKQWMIEEDIINEPK